MFLDFVGEGLITISVGSFLFLSQLNEFGLLLFQFLNFFIIFGIVWFLLWLFRHLWNLGVVSNFGLIVDKTKSTFEPTLFVLVSGFSVIVSVWSVLVVIRSVSIVVWSVVVVRFVLVLFAFSVLLSILLAWFVCSWRLLLILDFGHVGKIWMMK